MDSEKSTIEQWTTEIYPHKRFFKIDLKEIWLYRDMLYMFVKRDIVTIYKQTILGPIWFFIQPIMTSLTFMFVFGGIANISTDGIPHILFYLSGLIIWNYFSECFIQTADTFTQNANIFGKVYFPRIIIPISKIFSGLIKFSIQFILFIITWLFYYFQDNLIQPNYFIFLTPLLVILMAFIGLGLGTIFSSLTKKYRDLKFLINFGVQLLMYFTPIIYPMSEINNSSLKSLIILNPFSHIIEAFKYSYLGIGEPSFYGLLYSTFFAFFVFVFGILVFNKTERNFIDTV